MSEAQAVLLLTATFTPFVDKVRRRDPSVRRRDYRESLAGWRRLMPETKIVFVENSGADLEAFTREVDVPNVEWLSLPGAPSAPERGIGYAEAEMMEQAFAASRTLREAGLVIKATGRLLMPHAPAFLADALARRLDAQTNLARNLSFSDSRFVVATPTFWLAHFLPHRHQIDDSAGHFFEHALARAVNRCLADGGRWGLPPLPPAFVGVSGSSDTVLRAGWVQTQVLHLRHRLKRATIG